MRIVSELCHIPPETPGQHGDLRGHVDVYRCCVKSLIGNALVRFDVRQRARSDPISKRARSTTPPSLRFRINELRAVRNSVAQNPPSNHAVAQIHLSSALADVRQAIVSGIVSDLLISLEHLLRFASAGFELLPRAALCRHGDNRRENTQYRTCVAAMVSVAPHVDARRS